jgi:hypothetical protein
VRIAILIKDLSRGRKWRSAQDEIEKAKEVASIKNDKQDLIADLHKKIENLNQEKRQLNIEILDKDVRIKRLSDSLKDMQLEMI